MPERARLVAPSSERPADGLSVEDWARLEDGCRRQDPECFSRLVALTQRRLRRLLGRLVGRPADADDLVQETYLRAWRSAGQFRGECGLVTWLTRIAVNLALNWRRDRRPNVSLAPEHEQRSSVVGWDERAADAAYRRALAELAPELQAALVLRETEGLSYQQIADLLECPIGTVMSRLHRARAQLMAALREWLEESVP